MTIVAAYLYRNGERVGPVALDEPDQCAQDRSEFVWIGLFEPTEAELRKLQKNYGLPSMTLSRSISCLLFGDI